MTITISAEDPRSIKALEIAAEASRWIRCCTRDGRKLYAVPSQSKSGIYHLVDCQSCDCQDFKRHGLSSTHLGHIGEHRACKHVLAVRLHCELVKAQQPKRQPEPAAAPAPVLQMVREPDGTLSWERATDVERAARYDDIFSKFDGE